MNKTKINPRTSPQNASAPNKIPPAPAQTNVSALNKKPAHLPYVRFAHPQAARTVEARPWDVPDLCKSYGWPTGLTGGGVIAIVELGGGWLAPDLALFCANNKIPLPSITDVSVGGTRNNPGVDPDSDGEVALDIQLAAAAYSLATGKAATIRVYWATDIAPAVRAATRDHCDVCSISWGSDEAEWEKSAADDMEQAAAAAVSAGMIVFAAAGDNDSSDGGPNAANVDAPASCPHVIACGGTSKTPTTETVWNNDPGKPSGEGTGGGFSTLFVPVPLWQIGAPHGPGRMVPDISANADPDTGYNVVMNGEISAAGGTSAVAPLYAGLFAAFGTKLGWVLPSLWSNPVCFNDITAGDNGAFRAKSGPDACTGLGSPIAGRLAALVARLAAK